MKIFYDSEFMEDGKVILPLSFGFVAETGERLYVAILDADLSQANEWVRENVLPYLYEGYSNPLWQSPTEPEDRWLDDGTRYVLCNQADAGRVIEGWVSAVCGLTRHPEFWAWFGGYDWVLLCQLFGPMVEKPSGWPFFCRDLYQKMEDVGFTDRLPEVEGQAHRAIDDAINVKDRWEFLEAIKRRNIESLRSQTSPVEHWGQAGV